MTASTLLRASRRASGVTQGDLALRSRISQPNVSSIENGKRIPTVETLERLLRQTGHRLIAVSASGVDATETAERIATATSRDSALRAFLDFSDSLANTTDIDRIVLTVTEPPSTGYPSWDAALAALVDYWLSQATLPAPVWISSPSRFLDAPDSPQLGKYDLAPEVAKVPTEFLRRNVLLELSTLTSV
ncbi:helix-turn-helix transcriptional regulator [Rhodoglobus aureus]|uniref:HTH cro/C1-type domain-containing protein n=1 Tax=Rhodoglobus aureus TaxID=191497 RepID=A0ABP4G8P8_9MICO